MRIGERIKERLIALGISQAELARRVGLSQPAINALIRGASRSSTHLHRIARALETTAEYLTGETDDPDTGASPLQLREPLSQGVMMRVEFPNEAALTDMFEAQLRVFAQLQGRELAHALAKRLPKGLARLQEAPLYSALEPAPDDEQAAEPRATNRHESRHAQHR